MSDSEEELVFNCWGPNDLTLLHSIPYFDPLDGEGINVEEYFEVIEGAGLFGNWDDIKLIRAAVFRAWDYAHLAFREEARKTHDYTEFKQALISIFGDWQTQSFGIDGPSS